jgi:hypothetical protein
VLFSVKKNIITIQRNTTGRKIFYGRKKGLKRAKSSQGYFKVDRKIWGSLCLADLLSRELIKRHEFGSNI